MVDKKIIIPDTSIIIDGYLSDKIEKGELINCKILIPNAVIAEIEYQANFKRSTGFSGLEELKKLKKMANEKVITLEFIGNRPTLDQIKLSPGGEVDELIIKSAIENSAEFYTGDKIQSDIAHIKGVKVNYISKPIRSMKFDIEKFFDDKTMSVHLREGLPPKVKKGTPGNWSLIDFSNIPLEGKELNEIATQILERVNVEKDSFIEIDEPAASVIQLGNMRIVIARPPFSDALEITVVRPIKKVDLDFYDISDNLKKRLEDRAEGILIAGPPGAGKSTFGSALAEFYEKKKKIVKTMESPRDLQVGPEITQYSPLTGRMDKTADVLLLVRPDYVIYDEMRKTIDFKNYTDLRFSGVNMIGVVHASKPIDALQRFIGRIELGLISRVLDTIIFIEKGIIAKIYSIKMTVKVPSGMFQADLSRPVIEVRDFESNRLEYEIYTYGEEVVVVPITEDKKRKDNSIKGRVKVKVKPLRKTLRLFLSPELGNRRIQFYIENELVFDGTLNQNGYTVIKKSSNYAKKILAAIKENLNFYAIAI